MPPFRPRRRQPGADVHRGSRPQLGQDPPDVQRRQLGPVAAGQDDHVHGAHAALGPSVSLRAGRRVHRVRRLPLLDARSDRPNRYYMWTGWDGNDGRVAGRSSPTTSSGTAGRPTRSGCRRQGSAGRSTRTSATASTPPASGGLRQIRTSATTVITRCCTSSTTRTRPRAARCMSGLAPERTLSTALWTPPALVQHPRRRCRAATSCRACRGSSPPRRTPSIRPGPPATAPGTRPEFSTR